MSSPLQTSFLTAILGKDGLAALNKAIVRQPDLAEVLVPRTILSFVGNVQDLAYKGPIPGMAASVIALTKSGGVINGTSYTGLDANRYTMAAHLAILLGVTSDSKLAKNTRDIDLTRLGKAIDVLVKSRMVRKAKHTLDCTTHQDVACNCGAMEKADLPGNAAKPNGQDGPQGATAPIKAPSMGNAKASKKVLKPTKKPVETKETVPGLKAVPTVKIPEMKVGKSEASTNRCKVCDQTQAQNGRLTGCICLMALMKSATVTAQGDVFNITFGADWDQDAVEVLLECLHGTEE